jgi:hypothetical protein
MASGPKQSATWQHRANQPERTHTKLQQASDDLSIESDAIALCLPISMRLAFRGFLPDQTRFSACLSSYHPLPTFSAIKERREQPEKISTIIGAGNIQPPLFLYRLAPFLTRR